jgi:hypothetical protein
VVRVVGLMRVHELRDALGWVGDVVFGTVRARNGRAQIRARRGIVGHGELVRLTRGYALASPIFNATPGTLFTSGSFSVRASGTEAGRGACTSLN